MSTSLAIVEKKPPFAGGGGCASGMLFHLLDWHRRLARKRRLFSPRRLLPSSVRGAGYSQRRLPPPPPSPAPPPRPAQHGATRADGNAAPSVVARLMGLESWPATAAPPRPQKQRKVDAAASAGNNEPAVVVVLPQSQRQRPPVAPAPAQRSHHSADLSARSPRRSRLVHAAAAKLLDPGARPNSRANARLALAYACSSPQHRKDAIAGGHMLDDFLSRSDSLSLERSTPPAPPAHADRDIARCHEKHPAINTMSITPAATVVSSSHTTVVLPRIHFDDADTSRCSSDVDATRKNHRSRAEGMSSCGRIRSNSAGARTGEERLLRKRGTVSRPDVSRSVGSGNLVSSTRPIGCADRVLVPGSSSRRAAHNCSGPRRESMGSITPQRSIRRDMIDRSGLASTSRNSNNVSGPRRGSRKKVDRGTAASSRDDCNVIALASSSSVRAVLRASSHGKISEKRGFQSTQSDTACARMPVVDAKCLEAEPSVLATSEKEEFSRLLKAKINELGLSHRVEPSDAHSGNLTASVLQELISALTNATNTSASESSIYSDSSAPLNYTGTVYNSSDQSPDFQRCYQGDHEADSSATCTNNEPNQPSPTSVLEACFSNDTSSLGSPTEKIEGKEFFVSIENKMEDLFNLEPDIVDLAMSIDTTTKTDAPGSDEISRVQNFAAHDFKFLESRLHSIGEEAISNAELLLGSSLLRSTPSSPPLHSFIIEMLETIEGIYGRSDGLGLTEEKKYQRTNFLFDCIVESLNSKFCNFGKCGYKAWLRLPLALSKDLLKTEISEEIGSWREASEISSNRVAEKELDQLTARWDDCKVEAFDISIAIENEILAALVDEVAFDQR